MTNDNLGNSKDARLRPGLRVRRSHLRHRSRERRSAVLWTKISHTILFWAAFILTRPLGATLGDLLDKPVAQGGLHFSRLIASLILLACITAGVTFIPQRALRAGKGT